jgi:hypothetical protein
MTHSVESDLPLSMFDPLQSHVLLSCTCHQLLYQGSQCQRCVLMITAPVLVLVSPDLLQSHLRSGNQ